MKDVLQTMYETLSAPCGKILFINFSKPQIRRIGVQDAMCIYIADSDTQKTYVEKNENRHSELYDAVMTFTSGKGRKNIVNNLEEWMNGKKFDCIIMNPPYQKTLHLKILANVARHGVKEIVNLSPVVNYVSRKNAYSSVHIKKFDEQPLKEHCASVDRLTLDDMVKFFGAAAQNAIGIQHYVMNEHYDVTPTTYVTGDVELIRKIMNVCMADSLLNHKDGNFILRYSGIHGNMNEKARDTYFFMSLSWEAQLNTKGANTIGFVTEEAAHDFYDFWMSKYGIQLTKLWKSDTNVYSKFIPYFWSKPGKEKEAIMNKFKLTEDEFAALMDM